LEGVSYVFNDAVVLPLMHISASPGINYTTTFWAYVTKTLRRTKTLFAQCLPYFGRFHSSKSSTICFSHTLCNRAPNICAWCGKINPDQKSCTEHQWGSVLRSNGSQTDTFSSNKNKQVVQEGSRPALFYTLPTDTQ